MQKRVTKGTVYNGIVVNYRVEHAIINQPMKRRKFIYSEILGAMYLMENTFISCRKEVFDETKPHL